MRIARAWVFTITFLCVFFLGAQCAQRMKPDLGMSALAAGDYTALVEGCGNQLVPGYTYCRVSEGSASNQVLWFVAPLAQCLGEDPCVTFKIFFPNGEPSYGGSIPKTATRVSVAWKDLIKKDEFTLGDRGFWPFVYRIRWVDPSAGKEQVTQTEGEIRLRVLSKDYIGLQDVAEDENFVWKWSEGTIPVRMTTGGRTYVGRHP